MEKINEKYYLGSNKNTFILYEKKSDCLWTDIAL